MLDLLCMIADSPLAQGLVENVALMSVSAGGLFICWLFFNGLTQWFSTGGVSLS